MDQKERIRSELAGLSSQSKGLLKLVKSAPAKFYLSYQDWYTKTVQIVQVLAPDRSTEFRSYYEGDSKRKHISATTYCIRDFVRGVRPAPLSGFEEMRGASTFDPTEVVLTLFTTQIFILDSLASRIDGIVAELESVIAYGIQDAEIESAELLKKVNLRAAGALAGVILETHLQRVASAHKVVINKKHPTINDLNGPLKQVGVFDIPVFRRIQLLADIRNVCAHQKGREPTIDEINQLMVGVRSIVKTIY
jgi:hypothetical protein